MNVVTTFEREVTGPFPFGGTMAAPGTCWLDIETRKVETAPDPWPFRLRWQPFMVGVGTLTGGVASVAIFEGEEGDLIDWLNDYLPDLGTIRYAATRDFDRDVLCGHFTNARRGRERTPGLWPHLRLRDYDWINLRDRMEFVPANQITRGLRAQDPIEFSKDVPAIWKAGGREDVRRHCLIDVLEMMAKDAPMELDWRLP